MLDVVNVVDVEEVYAKKLIEPQRYASLGGFGVSRSWHRKHVLRRNPFATFTTSQVVPESRRWRAKPGCV